MAELNDLRLNDPTPSFAPTHEPAPGPSLLIPALIILTIVGIGIAAFLWSRRPIQPAPAKPAEAVSPVTTTVKAAEPGANIDVPPLDQSDALVRQLVSELSSHPRVAAWLTTDGLLRNFAAVVVNIADGDTPIKQLSKQRPTAPFAVRETPAGPIIDPQSFQRYDAYADAVAGLDARGAARLYATLKPRIAEAYRDLGYPEGNVDAAMERAIVVLLRTPRVGQSIAVKRTSVNWQFEDPALEALPRAERQLIRMGPRNQALIQDKLREIAPYLGIDAAKLPH